MAYVLPDSKNTPFQSLAADGAKLALWNLLHAGFDVYGFVHDEILVDLPLEAAEPRVESSGHHGAFDGGGPEGIPADCEWKICPRWAKPD